MYIVSLYVKGNDSACVLVVSGISMPYTKTNLIRRKLSRIVTTAEYNRVYIIVYITINVCVHLDALNIN